MKKPSPSPRCVDLGSKLAKQKACFSLRRARLVELRIPAKFHLERTTIRCALSSAHALALAGNLKLKSGVIMEEAGEQRKVFQRQPGKY